MNIFLMRQEMMLLMKYILQFIKTQMNLSLNLQYMTQCMMNQNLALESCPSEADEKEFEELFDSIYEPLLDQKVDLALKSEIELAQNTLEYEVIFRRCIHLIFENTLKSAMESTYRKMIDSMFYEKLEKTHQAYMDSMDSL